MKQDNTDGNHSHFLLTCCFFLCACSLTDMMGPRRRLDNQESPRMLMKDEAFPQ